MHGVFNFQSQFLPISSKSLVWCCLSPLLPSKMDTGHDIKLGAGAGAEYSHLGCVQLCSSAQRGHRGDTVMRAAGGLRP